MFFNVALSIIFIATCGIAFRWGGFDERLTACAFIANAILTNLVSEFDPNRYAHTATLQFYADVALLAMLLVLALRSDRFWPMWAAAFQLILILVHTGSGFQTGNFAWAYYAALIFWSFPLMLALAAGTWLEARSRREWDVDFR
jgi:hypothetical protein